MASRTLPWPSRLMALQYKVFNRMRHRQAFEVAHQEGEASSFDEFRGRRQCLLVSFRRDGEPVPTPVNFGLGDDGRLYFRSEPHVAKIARIRRDPHVRICPCNMRGKPTGPLVEGTARILASDEEPRAYAIVAANWRADMRIIEHGYDRIGVPAVYVEVAPAGAVEGAPT
jgi:uncharacterized protein